MAHHPLAPPPEGGEGASYIMGVIPSWVSILTAVLGSCVLAHVFSVAKERQGRLFAGRVDEDLLARVNAILLNKGPHLSAKMLVSDFTLVSTCAPHALV